MRTAHKITGNIAKLMRDLGLTPAQRLKVERSLVATGDPDVAISLAIREWRRNMAKQ